MREWYRSLTPEERKAWRERRDPAKAKASDRARYKRNREARLEQQKVYQQSFAGRAAKERAQKKYKSSNPLKRKAHSAVHNAVRAGRLVKEPCLFCDDPNSQAHHHDYTKPLEVTWLCDHHHKVAHGRLIQGASLAGLAPAEKE